MGYKHGRAFATFVTARQLGNGILLGMYDLGQSFQYWLFGNAMNQFLAVVVPARRSAIVSYTYNSVVLDDDGTYLEAPSRAEFSVPGRNIQVCLEYTCFQ